MKRHYDTYFPFRTMTATWGMPVTWIEEADYLAEDLAQEPDVEISVAWAWRFMALVGVVWLAAAALVAAFIAALSF